MTPPAGLLKCLFVDNAYLVRQEVRYYDPASNTFLPWSGPGTVSICTASTDGAGKVTYTPIAYMGPFTLNVGLNGTLYYEIPTSVVNILWTDAYINTIVYQVVIAGNLNELQNVQPLLVSPSRPPQ
jgi:hypothetical protein